MANGRPAWFCSRVQVENATGNFGRVHRLPYPHHYGTEALCGFVVPDEASGRRIDWDPDPDAAACKRCAREYKKRQAGG